MQDKVDIDKRRSNVKQSISVAIITLNEEHIIEKTLKSVSFADEIVVVDSGSTDQTVNICKRYTDKVIHNDWEGYAKQKNISIDRCSGDWVLSIDADEPIETSLATEIEEIISSGKPYDGYFIPRKTFFMGKFIKHGGWYPDYNLRLFKKDKGRFKERAVHEAISINGTTGKTKNAILHYTIRDLSDYLQTIDRYSSLAVTEMETKGKLKGKFTDMLIRPLWAFINKYFFRAGFLDGIPGIIINTFHAFYVFTKYSKAWEKKNENIDG